ncbi:hypothetical protein VCRA2110O175_270041 [Vibrio crassostreae]|nr:hypothetical protein VCRA2110O175_270041 [Vibrio crassostreae]
MAKHITRRSVIQGSKKRSYKCKPEFVPEKRGVMLLHDVKEVTVKVL